MLVSLHNFFKQKKKEKKKGVFLPTIVNTMAPHPTSGCPVKTDNVTLIKHPEEGRVTHILIKKWLRDLRKEINL